MGFKLFEVAKMDAATREAAEAVARKVAAAERTMRQNAEARRAAAERIRAVSMWCNDVIKADAPAETREAWIMGEIADLVNSGPSFSAEVHSILCRALRAVRREVACVRAAD